MLIIYKFLLLPLALIQSEKVYHMYLQMCAGISCTDYWVNPKITSASTTKLHLNWREWQFPACVSYYFCNDRLVTMA